MIFVSLTVIDEFKVLLNTEILRYFGAVNVLEEGSIESRQFSDIYLRHVLSVFLILVKESIKVRKKFQRYNVLEKISILDISILVEVSQIPLMLIDER